jgi:CheY-like chemotaxis protein
MKMDAVLIVEDDADIRESLVILLGSRGYTVVRVEDGAEAIHQLESGLDPCLIILDLMLPVMSGWEFRERQLKVTRWAKIPVVILSGADNLKNEAPAPACRRVFAEAARFRAHLQDRRALLLTPRNEFQFGQPLPVVRT